jgi:hypothetical protein
LGSGVVDIHLFSDQGMEFLNIANRAGLLLLPLPLTVVLLRTFLSIFDGLGKQKRGAVSSAPFFYESI